MNKEITTEQIASLRYLLNYVERWNKKDEDEEAAHAVEVLEPLTA